MTIMTISNFVGKQKKKKIIKTSGMEQYRKIMIIA